MLTYLYTFVISPVELVIEVIFMILYRLFASPGVAVICVSAVVSFLIAPLYRRADALQEEERKKQQDMAPWISHIRRSFRGDLRFMMLSEYYRQCGYKPWYTLRASLSLLLQIPFFIAAYHFLSNLTLLQSASFLGIGSLGEPDALIRAGDLQINLLPLIMTLVNLASGMIYLRGAMLREKIQVYGMALIFLILLYRSSAGLVLYWTCNNVFSLLKNILNRLLPEKTSALIRALLPALFGAALAVYVNFFYELKVLHATKRALSLLLFFLTALPLLRLIRSHVNRSAKTARSVFQKTRTQETLPGEGSVHTLQRHFLLWGLLMSALLGLLIPSAVIRSSPEEFIVVGNYFNPDWYYLSRVFLLAAGMFLLWAQVFFSFASLSGKRTALTTAFILTPAFLVDYLFFGRNYGNLTPNLTYDRALPVTSTGKALNLLLLLGIALLALLILKYLPKYRGMILSGLTISILLLSAWQIITTQTALAENDAKGRFAAYERNTSEEESGLFSFSRVGKNVIVIMLDRGISAFLPYLLEEFPALKEQLDGFTYYPNTVSHGAHTIFGISGLYGGYEYTPRSMNERASERLSDKHDEALKLLPLLFRDAGFAVSVYDQPMTHYLWTSDLSLLYEEEEGIRYGNLRGAYTSTEYGNYLAEQRIRSFFCYSLMRVSPTAVQQFLYDDGLYYGAVMNNGLPSPEFVWSYPVLERLNAFTAIREDDTDTFLILDNDTTHGPSVLQLPDYSFSLTTDNTGYDTSSRMDAEGHILSFDDGADELTFKHYCVNAAAWLHLGEWFDLLREEGVYDNTRIIVVSDHGFDLGLIDASLSFDPTFYNALLMVKDFDSTGFAIGNDFMTVADTPLLSMDGLIADPVNPFTGHLLSTADKEAVQYIYPGHDYRPQTHVSLNTFPELGQWYTLHDDLFDSANWSVVTK